MEKRQVHEIEIFIAWAIRKYKLPNNLNTVVQLREFFNKNLELGRINMCEGDSLHKLLEAYYEKHVTISVKEGKIIATHED